MEKPRQRFAPYVLYRNLFGESRTLPLRWALLIGRSRAVGLRVRDTTVSCLHCALLQVLSRAAACRRRYEWIVVDLDSLNGTWVNEQRITRPRLLRHGDCIRFGRTHLAIVILFD